MLIVDPWILFRRTTLAAWCFIAVVATTAVVYAYLPLRAAMDPPLNYADPVTLDRFLYVVLGQQFQGTFHAQPSLRSAISIVWDVLQNNIGLGAFLAVAGSVLGASATLRSPCSACSGS